jgi:hypothetical protein
MEKNIKLRVIVPYRDIQRHDEYMEAQRTFYESYKRAKELYDKGLVSIMEIEKQKNK